MIDIVLSKGASNSVKWSKNQLGTHGILKLSFSMVSSVDQDLIRSRLSASCVCAKGVIA